MNGSTDRACTLPPQRTLRNKHDQPQARAPSINLSLRLNAPLHELEVVLVLAPDELVHVRRLVNLEPREARLEHFVVVDIPSDSGGGGSGSGSGSGEVGLVFVLIYPLPRARLPSPPPFSPRSLPPF